MVDEKLIKQVLVKLEKERGCPVQMIVVTPETVETPWEHSGAQIYGSFDDRRLTVKRVEEIVFNSGGITARQVEELSNQYAEIVGLLEGSYGSLDQLRKKMQEHDLHEKRIFAYADRIVHDTSSGGSISERIETKIADVNLELLTED